MASPLMRAIGSVGSVRGKGRAHGRGRHTALTVPVARMWIRLSSAIACYREWAHATGVRRERIPSCPNIASITSAATVIFPPPKTLSAVLHRTGRQHYGSAWPNYLGEELQKAVAEVRKITSGDAATAAEDALGRMFNRSATWP